MTDVSAAVAQLREKTIPGVLVSDRVGEVKFVSVEKLLGDGLKPMPNLNGKDAEEREDEVLRTLFGQQQETVAIAISSEGRTLIAIDTLNRIRISEWPNVFSIRHMILQH
jgi:hypothetical protein